METVIHPIAHIRSDFSEKFTIPRQSGLVRSLRAEVVFQEAYRDMSAVRGLEEFSHLWLIWGFSQVEEGHWSPTVRPPRLGGNKRMGVFATRSPFRPNRLGLSCLELLEVRQDRDLGPVLAVGGGDLLDGTPIYDIKPYLPYAPTRWGVLPRRDRERRCGWRSPRRCWSGSPRRSGRPFSGCWPRTPAPPTSGTRRVSTARCSAGWRSGSGWRERCWRYWSSRQKRDGNSRPVVL